MASLTNDEAIERWVQDAANGGLRPRRGYSAGTVKLRRETGELIYYRAPRPDRGHPAWGPVTLGRFARESRTFILNGDGFRDGLATRWQSNLRAMVQESINRANGVETDTPGGFRRFARFVDVPEETQYILLPYAAMDAAEIDPDTIQPIHVTQDRWEDVVHPLPKPPAESAYRLVNGQRQSFQRIYEATKGGVRFRSIKREVLVYYHRKTGRRETAVAWGERDQYDTKKEWVWQAGSVTAWRAGRRAVAAWVNVRQDDNGGYFFSERIHHLGAAVFSARSNGSGRRSYISGFDDAEPSQLYYLAQLPRRVIRSYDEAIAALAPPIVHDARARGVRVLRQGDIFAIETTHTDEEMRAMSRTRVRREVATHDDRRQGLVPPAMDDWDTKEMGECPCCHTRKRIGWGPRARRVLRIYNTTHTADEVVVARGGACYVKGTMYHDPHLETPGRRAEHATLELGEGDTWWLCVRNTVPRQMRGSTDNN